MANSYSGLILENSLQSFFYDQLMGLNRKSINPLPNESIYYSSLVMDRFGESDKYFEVSDSGVKEKVLGISLLEASELPLGTQKRRLVEIGDTALLLCGYFSESVSRKIVDVGYYHTIGVSAYNKLNALIPSLYDIENFYNHLATSFQDITNLMGIVSRRLQSDVDDQLILFISDRKKSA